MGLERITVVDRYGEMQSTIIVKMTGTCMYWADFISARKEGGFLGGGEDAGC